MNRLSINSLATELAWDWFRANEKQRKCKAKGKLKGKYSRHTDCIENLDADSLFERDI